MTCRNTRENLVDYLDGTAPDAIRTAIEVELSTCPACRSTVRQARELRRELAALPRQDTPPTVRKAVLEAVRRSVSLQSKQNDPPKRLLLQFPRPLVPRPLAAAALLLVGTIGAFVVGSSLLPGREPLRVVILDVDRDLDADQRTRLTKADPFAGITVADLGFTANERKEGPQ